MKLYSSALILSIVVVTEVVSHFRNDYEIDQSCYQLLTNVNGMSWYTILSHLKNCLFTGATVLNLNGDINKKKLAALLMMVVKDEKVVKELVDICAVKQKTPVHTAIFLYYVCLSGSSTDPNLHIYYANFEKCLLTQAMSGVKEESPANELLHCYLHNGNFIESNGNLDEFAVQHFLEKYDYDLSWDEIKSMVNCVKAGNNPSETIENISKCIGFTH